MFQTMEHLKKHADSSVQILVKVHADMHLQLLSILDFPFSCLCQRMKRQIVCILLCSPAASDGRHVAGVVRVCRARFRVLLLVHAADDVTLDLLQSEAVTDDSKVGMAFSAQVG